MLKIIIPAILGISITLPFLRSSAAQALQSQEINSIADRVVVLIKTQTGYGSGVVIQRSGDTYTILTSAHVVNDRYSPPLSVMTGDRQQYAIDPNSIKISPNRLDLATITFQSQQHYPIVQIGDSNTVTRGQSIFAAGFQGSTLQFYPGKVVANSRQPQDRGYGLAIGNADILPGMSGGALFDRSGVLVGINGKSVGKIDRQYSKNILGNNTKPVSGLAIPINTFTEIASQLQVNIAKKPLEFTGFARTADDHFVSGQNKAQKGDYRGAIADYDRTLSLNPDFEEVYFRRGLARNVLQDWRGAEADYTKAIAIKPNHAEVYTNRGLIRNILADWQGAKNDFDIALILNPQNIFAYVGRGIARCELKDCQGGLKDYNYAIGLNPTDPEAYKNRAQAHRTLGNNSNALADYQAAADIYLRQGKDMDYLQTVQKIENLVRRRG